MTTGKRMRRFKWTGLPRTTRRRTSLVNALLSHLPPTLFDRRFKDRLRKTIEPLVHADVDFWFAGVDVVEAGGLRRCLAEPLCVGVVGLLPRPWKMLVEVD